MFSGIKSRLAKNGYFLMNGDIIREFGIPKFWNAPTSSQIAQFPTLPSKYPL